MENGKNVSRHLWMSMASLFTVRTHLSVHHLVKGQMKCSESLNHLANKGAKYIHVTTGMNLKTSVLMWWMQKPTNSVTAQLTFLERDILKNLFYLLERWKPELPPTGLHPKCSHQWGGVKQKLGARNSESHTSRGTQLLKSPRLSPRGHTSRRQNRNLKPALWYRIQAPQVGSVLAVSPRKGRSTQKQLHMAGSG